MKTQQIFFLSLTLILAVLISAKSHGQSRFDVIEKLQGWRGDTAKRSDLEDREKDLRLQFINRLIFQVERKYKGNSLRDFFQTTLEDMTETDRLRSNRSFGARPVFLENLNLSLINLLEQNEKPLELIQDFTEYSGISEPATVDEFAETRTYYDGRRTLGVQTLSIEEATNHLETYEKEQERLRLAEQKIQQEKLLQIQQEQQIQDTLSQPEFEWIDFREDLRQDFIPHLPNEIHLPSLEASLINPVS